MAKDKEFKYGSVSIPRGEAKYSVIRWGFGGLNRTNTIDSGQLTDCEGVVVEPPYIYPTLIPHNFKNYTDAISVFGFGDRIFVIYRSSSKIKIDCIDKNNNVYTGIMGNAKNTSEDFTPRIMVQFNVASNTENIVSATYVRKLLIFPDLYSIDFDINANFTPKSLGNTYPKIKYATVYGSRVFGVDDNLVYASSYNDYADWDLDTADEYSEANAWVSMSQSNVKADGSFSAIATYDNHVVLFKKDFMQLVYNNKNPFRIVDVGGYGCDNPYAVTECGGILYFASSDAVYAFTGGTPKKISDALDINSFRGAVLGSWSGKVYMCVSNTVYVYKDGVWSCSGVVDGGIKQFASCKYGIAALYDNGNISFVDWSDDKTDDITANWALQYGNIDGGSWWFETDFMAVNKLDVRRIKKISILCDVNEGSHIDAYLLKNDEEFNAEKSQLVGTTNKDGRVIMRVLMNKTAAYMHRLRIVGNGKVKILALELQLSWGGDLYDEG